MKIKSLNIDSYRHLQNLIFNFTYPEGHPKFGQPLEKVCIIGQSATGKTNILELIKDALCKINKLEIFNGQSFFHHFRLNFEGQFEFLYDNKTVKITTDEMCIDEYQYKNLPNGSGSISYLFSSGLKLLYLSSEVISKESVNIFNQNPINILTDLPTEQYSGFEKRYTDSNYIIEFVQDINAEIWISLLYKILDYRKKFNQWASELLNKGLIGDLNKLNKQIAKWSETNKNPLAPFAESFNPILRRLNLEIDLVNTEYTIPIKSQIKDEVVPISSLSTGTKGLLLSMFPLYELDTNEAIILMDEPERSLFPDMQIDLISHYQNLAPNAQFIVATHSPFIAAAFEPEERFILYFNEEGQVSVRRGESPIGDDPNDILRNDFNVSYYNDFGKQAYEKYLDLKRKVIQETEPEKKKELIVELADLGDKYNF